MYVHLLLREFMTLMERHLKDRAQLMRHAAIATVMSNQWRVIEKMPEAAVLSLAANSHPYQTI